MITEVQADVLVALNDLCELEGRVLLDHETGPLPERLQHLNRPDMQVYQAVADLYDLGLIDGVRSQRDYLVRVSGLTARGRQALPVA